MITSDAVLAARKLEPSWRTHFATTPAAPGWITTGEFAAFTSDVPPEMLCEPEYFQRSDVFAKSVEGWMSGANREPVAEDRPLRVAGKPGRAEQSTPCKACGGAGDCHGCSCGARHDCGVCDGEGRKVQVPYLPEHKGRAIYRSADGEWTFVADKLARLLDGYTLYRWSGELQSSYAAESPEHARRLMPIIGCDADGRVVVCVMPMRATEAELKLDERPDITAMLEHASVQP